MTNEIHCYGQAGKQCSALVTIIEAGSVARQITGRSHRCVTGNYMSSKMACTFPMESRGEEAVLLLADVLESVAAFRAQAVKVRFLHDGKLCTAYPDLAVQRLDGSVELWETKPHGPVSDALARRLRSLRLALNGVGIPYRIRQPHWAQRQPIRANALLVRRYTSTGSRHIPAEEVHQYLLLNGTTLLGNLKAAFKASLQEILALAAKGQIGLDIGSAPIGECTPVRLASPGATSGCFTNISNEEN